jgi:hypothetical protein
MTDPELLPCPFCGTTPHVWGVQNVPALESIGCANDDCKVQPSTDYLPDDQSITAWNRRTTTTKGDTP